MKSMGNTPDPFRLLFKLHRQLTHLTRQRPEHPGLTAWSRGLVLLFGLGVAGPTLWAAVGSMPSGVVFLIMLGLAIRLSVYAWRRFR